MLEIPATQPYCRCCGDFYYTRDADGALRVCPRCSCPACERLRDTHPDLGGCTCEMEAIEYHVGQWQRLMTIGGHAKTGEGQS
jgi:hypothetical protein